jgi:hypothetical protein
VAARMCQKPGCGRKGKAIALTGDIFSARLCDRHYREQQHEKPDWLAGGDCVRCRRARGGIRVDFFYGRDETSVCLPCSSRCSRWKAKGAKVPTVEEDREMRNGCGNCGCPEWYDPEGTALGLMHGWKTERRCNACFFYPAGHGDVEERPLEEWSVT